MISAAVWVARGVPKSVPEFYEPTEEEIAELVKKQEIALDMMEKTKGHGDDDDFDENESSEDENEDNEGQEGASEDGNGEDEEMEAGDLEAKEDEAMQDDEEAKQLMKELKIDEYDDEPEDTPLFGGLKGLSYHADNTEDPYITMEEERDEDDINDLVIKDTDMLILVAKTEDDVSHLEVHIYEEDEDNLYVHHDVMLPAFPLCVEWVGYGRKDGKPGNFAAVGTFQPEIEVWNVDVVDALYPHFVIGEQPQEEKLKSKKPKKSATYHTDAVLGLSWNKAHENILASASADKTVKLWDLATLGCLRSFEHHKDKVQALEWNPAEGSVILTGSYDKTVAAFDTRVPDAVSKWTVSADVEVVRWNPTAPQYFLVSTENGMVTCIDARHNGSKPVFTLSAHDEAVCALHFNPKIPNCIVTGSYDKTVKVWDITDHKPACVVSRDLGIGKIFAVSFCPDSPFLVTAAGGKGKVTVWDAAESVATRKHFEPRIIQQVATPNPVNSLGDQLLQKGKASTDSAPAAAGSKGKKEEKTDESAMSDSGASSISEDKTTAASASAKKKNKKNKNKGKSH